MEDLTREYPELMKIGDAARFLGVSRRTVYRRVWSGELPASRVGGLYLIRKADLETLLIKGRDKVGEEPDLESAPLKCGSCYRLIAGESQIGEVCLEEGCEEMICRRCLEEGIQHCARHVPNRLQLTEQARARFQSGELNTLVEAPIGRLREVNFINRIETRLSGLVTVIHPLSGEVISVEDWKSILEFGDERAELMRLINKVVLDGQTMAQTPLGASLVALLPLPKNSKSVSLRIEVRVLARLEEYLRSGYDCRPMSAEELAPWLLRLSSEAQQEQHFTLVLLASLTGWDATARLIIQGSPGGELPFAHRLMIVYLYDMEKGDLIYPPQDERTRQYTELFIPLLPSEELAEIVKVLGKELTTYDSLTLEYAAQVLPYSERQLRQAFNRLAKEGLYALTEIPNLGLAIVRH